MGFPISGSLIAVSNNDILFDKRVYEQSFYRYNLGYIICSIIYIYSHTLYEKYQKLRNIKIDSFSVRRAVITEKQSVKSKDLINRSRNRFVAAKIDDTIRVIVL